MTSEDGRPLPMRELILVPALITLGVTLLRLVGELLGWSPVLFGKAAGGGLSVVGISWVVLIFGFYFGFKLVRLGFAPAAGRAAGFALLAVLVLVAAGGLGGGVLKLGQLAMIVVFTAASLVAVLVAHRGWPALSKVLIAYALAARIPVLVVMLIAMLGNWGTHYDVAPPTWPEVDQYSVWTKWFAIGVLPQLSFWIAYTVILGLLCGALGAVVARRRPQPAAA